MCSAVGGVRLKAYMHSQGSAVLSASVRAHCGGRPGVCFKKSRCRRHTAWSPFGVTQQAEWPTGRQLFAAALRPTSALNTRDEQGASPWLHGTATSSSHARVRGVGISVTHVRGVREARDAAALRGTGRGGRARQAHATAQAPIVSCACSEGQAESRPADRAASRGARVAPIRGAVSTPGQSPPGLSPQRSRRSQGAGSCAFAAGRAGAHLSGTASTPARAAVFWMARSRRPTAPKVGRRAGGPPVHCCTRASSSRWADSRASMPAVKPRWKA